MDGDEAVWAVIVGPLLLALTVVTIVMGATNKPPAVVRGEVLELRGDDSHTCAVRMRLSAEHTRTYPVWGGSCRSVSVGDTVSLRFVQVWDKWKVE
jgi:hypothetical protein